MELRPYQEEAIRAIETQWQSGIRRTLLVLPTGAGKTIVFCKLTERQVRNGARVLIMAHRGELLEQAADKLMKWAVQRHRKGRRKLPRQLVSCGCRLCPEPAATFKA